MSLKAIQFHAHAYEVGGMRPKWCGEVIPPPPHWLWGKNVWRISNAYTYFYFILFFNLHISYPAWNKAILGNSLLVTVNSFCTVFQNIQSRHQNSVINLVDEEDLSCIERELTFSILKKINNFVNNPASIKTLTD